MYLFLDTSLCVNLYFEKTRTLNRYTVKLGAFIRPVILTFEKEKIGFDKFGGVNGDISREIWTKLNASGTIKFYSTMGSFDQDEKPHGFYKDLQLQKIDYVMNMIFLRHFWKLQTYPHEASGICLISFKDRSLLISINKFFSIFTPLFWIFTVVLSAIIIILLKFSLKETVSSSSLELLRMIISVSSQKEPQNSTSRLIFAFIIFSTMLTNTYFQSTLSSVNIAPEPNPVIDTIEGLVKSNMSVHGMASMRQYVQNKALNSRYYVEDTSKCTARLLQGQRVACITGCISARYNIYEGELIHISSERRHTFMTFLMRKDWPLSSRVNQILRKLSEGGLITLFRKREQRYFMKPPLSSALGNRQISLLDIGFALCVLILGIFLSTFTFILEIMYMRTKINFSGK